MSRGFHHVGSRHAKSDTVCLLLPFELTVSLFLWLGQFCSACRWFWVVKIIINGVTNQLWISFLSQIETLIPV